MKHSEKLYFILFLAILPFVVFGFITAVAYALGWGLHYGFNITPPTKWSTDVRENIAGITAVITIVSLILSLVSILGIIADGCSNDNPNR